MLQQLLSLVQNELNHDARNKSQGNRHHKGQVGGSRSLLLVLERLIDREWASDDIELDLGRCCRNPQNCIEHKLRVEASHVLRCSINVVDHLVKVCCLVCLIDLVASKAVGERRTIMSRGIHSIIERGVVEVFVIGDFECICDVWKHREKLRAFKIVVSRDYRVLVH